MVKRPKQQARSVSVRKKDKCLVSNGIWLELGFGLQDCRLRAGDGPLLAVIWRWNGGRQPGRQLLGGVPTPPLHRRGLRPRAGWGLDLGHPRERHNRDKRGKVSPSSSRALSGKHWVAWNVDSYRWGLGLFQPLLGWVPSGSSRSLICEMGFKNSPLKSK